MLEKEENEKAILESTSEVQMRDFRKVGGDAYWSACGFCFNSYLSKFGHILKIWVA